MKNFEPDLIMNLPGKLSLAVILLLVSQMAYAQDIFPAAVSTQGILLGRYKITSDSRNPLPDTISIAEAKNFFAVNALYTDGEKQIHRLKIVNYQMTIREKDDTTTFTITGNSEKLSDEMKERLSRIKSGAKLFFEGIRTESPDGSIGSVILLAFTVI